MSQTLTTSGSGGIAARRLRELGLTDDDIVAMIQEEDASEAETAQRVGVSLTSLRNWLHNDPVRSARVRQAREDAAEACLRKAAAVIDDCPDDATAAQIAKMREKRAHWERRAAIRNPRYSDKVQIEHRQAPPLSQMSDQQLAAIAFGTGPVIDGVLSPDGPADGAESVQNPCNAAPSQAET